MEWSGQSDALLKVTTSDGRRHAEYVGVHGVYLDLPFQQLLRAFAMAYAHVDVRALADAGLPVGEFGAEELQRLLNAGIQSGE